jgi:hypothetical protein
MFSLIILEWQIKQKLLSGLVALLFFFVGSILFQSQKNFSSFFLDKYARKVVCIFGTITDKQEIATTRRQELVTIAVEQVKEEGADDYEATAFSIMCNTRKNRDLLVGDIVLIDNIIIKKPTTTSLSKNPPFSDYMIKEGILASIFTNLTNKWSLINRPTWSLKRWIWQKRTSLYNKLMSKCSFMARSYFSLIFLGNKQQSKNLEDLRITFSLWGLSHYLARSGLHIVLFILFFQWLLRLLPIYLPIKRIFLMFICIIYSILSWSSTPFLRAYSVFLLMEGGKLFLQQTNFIHILTFVCLVTLLFNPMQLFFLDFQLSFALTFALAFTSTHKIV